MVTESQIPTIKASLGNVYNINGDACYNMGGRWKQCNTQFKQNKTEFPSSV
jgi:hypothetical protein